MKSLIDAITQRFESDKTLKRFSRRLHAGLGDTPIKTLPYAVLEMDGPSSEFDTFGADLESFTVTFTLFGKDSIANKLHSALDAMRRVFDDCSLISSEFSLVQFHRIGGSTPTLVEDKFQATLEYTVIVQLTTLEPVTRVG